jgi:hypothetical protein
MCNINKKQNFYEFFDPANIDHLLAFNYLNTNGCWPEDFIPENCKMGGNWYVGIIEKMALALTKFATNGMIVGMPPCPYKPLMDD